MGTFHDTADPLHGITVVAETGETIYIGRCHARQDGHIVLHDVDQHTEGQDGKSKRDYLERAARFGVWKKHDKMTLVAAEVTSLTPLSDHFRRPGEQKAPATATAAPAAKPQTGTPVALATMQDDAPVQLTEAAATEVRRLLVAENRTDQGLRLAVSGGGCSGLVYKVEFDAEKDGDIIVPCDGFNVLMDRKSTIYLRGVTLDHQQGLSGRGFQFQNPNASNTCGCGESFSV